MEPADVNSRLCAFAHCVLLKLHHSSVIALNLLVVERATLPADYAEVAFANANKFIAWRSRAMPSLVVWPIRTRH